jgi:hypothetical protein
MPGAVATALCAVPSTPRYAMVVTPDRGVATGFMR